MDVTKRIMILVTAAIAIPLLSLSDHHGVNSSRGIGKKQKPEPLPLGKEVNRFF